MTKVENKQQAPFALKCSQQFVMELIARKVIISYFRPTRGHGLSTSVWSTTNLHILLIVRSFEKKCPQLRGHNVNSRYMIWSTPDIFFFIAFFFNLEYSRYFFPLLLHHQYSFSKLWIVCTLNASSRSIEMMEMAVHTLCFTQLNYSTIDCSLGSVQCGRVCRVVNVADYVR